jgi:hypothetical protein
MSWVPMNAIRRSSLPRHAIRHDAVVLVDADGVPVAYVQLFCHTWDRVPEPVFTASVKQPDGEWWGDYSSNSRDIEAVKRWAEATLESNGPRQLSMF